MSRHRDVALPTTSTRSAPADGRRSGGTTAGLLVLAVLLASVAAGCGRGDQTASTNSGSPAGTTTPAGAATSSAPPATSAGGSSPGSAPAGDPGRPGEVPPSPGGGVTSPSSAVPGPTTTCVRGPATTAPGQRGGGEITCSTLPPDGSVSSPPMTDTTIPVDETAPLQPDSTHGVLRGSVGGAACPATAQQCIDLYRTVPARVDVRGPVATSTHTASFGDYQVRLPPGRYEVVATPDAAGNTCVATTADVVAAQVVAVSIDCRPAS
jgi:hypothetical protein